MRRARLWSTLQLSREPAHGRRPFGTIKEVAILRETFGTFTDDLECLRGWLKEHKGRRVAMESKGVYWIPAWNILEPKQYGLGTDAVNPQLVEALPGCKTDGKDADRSAELHQYGLLRFSFRPGRFAGYGTWCGAARTCSKTRTGSPIELGVRHQFRPSPRPLSPPGSTT